jgi:hypothetical protein
VVPEVHQVVAGYHAVVVEGAPSLSLGSAVLAADTLWIQMPRPRLQNVMCSGCGVEVVKDEVRLIIVVHKPNMERAKANYFHGNAACILLGCRSRVQFSPTLTEVEEMVDTLKVGTNPPNNEAVRRELDNDNVIADFIAIRAGEEADRRTRQAATRRQRGRRGAIQGGVQARGAANAAVRRGNRPRRDFIL